MDKIQHPPIIKALGKRRRKGNFLKLIQDVYGKPTENIILKKLYAFPPTLTR